MLHPRSRRLRRTLLGGAALALLAAPSCGDPSGGPASLIETLRVLAVTADNPYAAPGDTVKLRLTYADAGEGDDGPRPIEITWLGGCLNPTNGDFAACYPQLVPALLAVRDGEAIAGLTAQAIAPPEKSGVPDSVSFDLAIPDDALPQGATPEETAKQGVAFVFFAACAGKARPVPVGDEGGFPLECIGDDGAALDGNSFVVGYTRVHVFADGRENQNPPVLGLTLDGEPLGADPESAPVVSHCSDEERVRQQGCGDRVPEPCPSYEIAALVDDVAEEDTESPAPAGVALREAVWVNHFADRGSFDGSTRLISDTLTGYQKDHATSFLPPSEPGLVTLWAVVRDSRGGESVARAYLRVE